MEADDTIVTWCVGHLVSMSYPDAYDAALHGDHPFYSIQI